MTARETVTGATSWVKLHPLVVRLAHWINAIAMIVMIGSGWRIYNFSPIFPFKFPILFTIGGEVETSLAWHNEDGLAGALQWHFLAMWILVINGLVYLIYGLLSGRFRRNFLPIWPSEVLHDLGDALRFKLDHRLGHYNAVQKSFYVGVILAAIVMVLSGLAIWKPVQFQELTWLCGGFQGARLVHFFGMSAIVLFLLVHIALTILVPKTLPPMITGRARRQEVEGPDGMEHR